MFDHVTIRVSNREAAERFYTTVLGTLGLPPGERPIHHDRYYGAFVLDPGGNNVEVVNHNRAG